MHGGEFVQDLREEDKGYARGIFKVGRDGSRETVGSDIAVDDVGFVSDGLALAWLCAFGECLGEEC